MQRHYYYYCVSHLLLHSFMAFSAMGGPNITTDQRSLLAFKARIHDPKKFLSNNWSAAISPCNWIGVTCSSLHNRVTALNLSRMALAGPVSPHLGNLSFLVSLDLSSNSFHGYLPQNLISLRRLRFVRLAVNNFIGEVPSWFGFLPNLQFLNMRNNSFTGSLPASLSNASKLETLALSFNLIEGSIPEEFGKFLSLRWLSLQGNQLTGHLSSAILNITTLENIFLPMNSLSGSLPADKCSHLPNLVGLSLSVNELEGQIPSSLSECSRLQILSLSYNNFAGSIPREIGGLENLQILYLGGNHLTGVIPKEIGNLHKAVGIAMEENKISGSIPLSIFNISSLQQLNLGANQLSGSMPREVGRCTMLQYLSLNNNNFTGLLPEEISNLSQMIGLALEYNNFMGKIPLGIFNMSFLTMLNVGVNHLSGILPTSLGYGLPNLEFLGIFSNHLNAVDLRTISNSSQFPELSFFSSLTSSRNLEILLVRDNPLNGVLPSTIGQLLTSLKQFIAAGCGIKGGIPKEVGNLSRLIRLDLGDNELTGVIPTTIQGLQSIQQLWLYNVQVKGSIPISFCKLQNLGGLDLSDNQLSSSIPECFGNITSLRYLYLGNNWLTSNIPSTFWMLQDLLELNLSSNSFTGSLPSEIAKLKVLTKLDLSRNNFSGNIPSSIGSLQNLAYIILAQNRLEGSIPVSMGSLLSLEMLDLSRNNLSGSIPKSLEALKYLQYFNVSFNDLRDEIPSNGPFKNFTSLSFLSNEALCGNPKFQVPLCKVTSNHKSRRRRKTRQIVSFTMLGIAALVLVLTIAFLLYRKQKKNMVTNQTGQFDMRQPVRVSYYELLQATEGYSEANLIGKGSFGSVYKGTLKDGALVAVKVFDLQLEEDAYKSFDRECEVLRNIRHRNLTRIISCCSNPDFKALVLEYMSNGSLEDWLRSEDGMFDLAKRLNAMIDVAIALDYLHHGYSVPIVHCDLKPANILFDENMTAHVSDFGVAKLLGAGNTFVHTKTLATFGYMAPEYGTDGLVSTRCDLYSFGILLMETFSGRNPQEEIFVEDYSLKQFIIDSLSNSIVRVTDMKLLRPEDAHFLEKLDCVKSIMELALHCCMDSPGERINSKDVVVALKNIKLQLSTLCI